MKKFFFFLTILATICSCKKEKTDYTETDHQIILDYIASHKLTDAKATSSGLYYVIKNEGSSKHPSATSTVIIKYTGKLTDETVFDMTSANSSATINLSNVIKGWQEGIPLFGKGGKGILLIPSALGYGSTGNNGISANSVLIFNIELIDFY
jgi:FKBP-type peptidyl-prolyl cis-trans isomerase FkpA